MWRIRYEKLKMFNQSSVFLSTFASSRKFLHVLKSNSNSYKIKLLYNNLKVKEDARNYSFYRWRTSDKVSFKFTSPHLHVSTLSILLSSKKEDSQPNNLKKAGSLEKSASENAPKVEQKNEFDFMIPSFERNFVTKEQAVSNFLLKPSDMEALRSIVRRSPYEDRPSITVYWRKQVEARALEIYGTREKLMQEKLKRELEREEYNQEVFNFKKLMKDIKKRIIDSNVKQQDAGLMSQSGKVILVAVGINAFNFFIKVAAWIMTGSHTMFSECIHSFADTINQLILAYGVQKSIKAANTNHPYGYTNMKYVASLISGVGIFCVGSGLSFYHGFIGLMHPTPITDIYWAYFVLTLSIVTESYTCYIALNSARKSAEKLNMPLFEYIKRGQEPAVNVVLMEDLGAVLGVILAGSCITISALTQSHIPDAIGSLLVGGILGSVASFIIYTNANALLGRSIPQTSLDKINSALEGDPMIRGIHDVKGIDMGNSLIKYKAELDFDGKALTKVYLAKQNLNDLLQEINQIENIDMVEEFFLKHGEGIVDNMGAQIDRIEIDLRRIYPELRHCDLEIM